jgi:hypothetical protein
MHGTISVSAEGKIFHSTPRNIQREYPWIPQAYFRGRQISTVMFTPPFQLGTWTPCQCSYPDSLNGPSMNKRRWNRKTVSSDIRGRSGSTARDRKKSRVNHCQRHAAWSGFCFVVVVTDLHPVQSLRICTTWVDSKASPLYRELGARSGHIAHNTRYAVETGVISIVQQSHSSQGRSPLEQASSEYR